MGKADFQYYLCDEPTGQVNDLSLLSYTTHKHSGKHNFSTWITTTEKVPFSALHSVEMCAAGAKGGKRMVREGSKDDSGGHTQDLSLI